MKIKQRRGISLVALIITIIVLIILTGAVIMSITGENNTMEKASEAVNKHNLSMYKEEFTRNVMQKELETNGTFDRKTLTTANLKEYVPSATDEDLANLGIKNGELVYTNTANEEEFTVAAELNMADLSSVAAGTVQVGEYIKYTPGAGTYTAKKEQTGHSEDKTYESTGSAEDWRVLSVKGAEVTIVRQKVLPELTLFGPTGYDNAVQELNKICSIYKDNKYAKEARSITVEDVNGVTGYSSSDMAAYGGGSSSQGGYGYTNPTPIHNYITGQDETHTQDSYSYTGTSKIANTTEGYKMLFRNKANSSNISYWVASRCVYVGSGYVSFFVRGCGRWQRERLRFIRLRWQQESPRFGCASCSCFKI